jgi:biopolymer transport protein ExbB/TolQ
MFQSFREGGVFMYFILIFGILTISLIIERAQSLFMKLKEPTPEFRQKIADYLGKGDVKGAEAYAMSKSDSLAIGRIAEIGCQLRANAGGDEEIQARMDEALSTEISAIDKRTGFLAMFGNVSTLLGLLGTISGMIHSFAAVANASPVDRATMLAKGISEAMNCTAFGLVVAIPALVAFAVFQNRTDRIVTQITELTSQIYHDLVFFVDGGNKTDALRVTASGKAVASQGLSV